MKKKNLYPRRWIRCKKKMKYIYDEYFRSVQNSSTIEVKDGIASCQYILRGVEAGLDTSIMRSRISKRMKKHRVPMGGYICVVSPRSARGTTQYEIQYYQKLEEPTKEFAEDFEAAIINSAKVQFNEL